MTDQTFNIGDVVILKGGKVQMTVERTDGVTGMIDTVWHGDKNSLHRSAFPPAALHLIVPPESPWNDPDFKLR